MRLEAGNDNRRVAPATHRLDGALPDWLPDIERLKREAQLARDSGRPDPWSLAEAECWRDLVEAEIAAQVHDGAGQDVLAMLRTWKTELGAVIRTLQALERSPGAATAPVAEPGLAA